MTMIERRTLDSCTKCGRTHTTYETVPCPSSGVDCFECDISVQLELGEAGTHTEVHRDVDEVPGYRCPHGSETDFLCKGCGHHVGGYGMGSAGFGDLCGCVEDGTAFVREGRDT